MEGNQSMSLSLSLSLSLSPLSLLLPFPQINEKMPSGEDKNKKQRNAGNFKVDIELLEKKTEIWNDSPGLRNKGHNFIPEVS